LFHQLLTPVFNSLLPSFFIAILPILTVLVLLGALRRPAWQASLAGLFVGFIVAVGPWRFPSVLALSAIANGAMFAVWPVMWIVFNSLLLYNVAVKSGRFEAFREWIVKSLPSDRRVLSSSSLVSRSAHFSRGSPALVHPSRLQARCSSWSDSRH
jgi:lactate permease